MSSRIVYECDKCGKECPYTSLGATVGRRADAAGSMENIWEKVDLCPLCCHVELQKLLSQMDYDTATKWINNTRVKRVGRNG